jgi:glutathione-independent formaldehyde dehydrogenase
MLVQHGMRTCTNCKERYTNVWRRANEELGHLKFSDKSQTLEKIRDLTLLSDILPTGFHGCIEAKSDRVLL